MMKNNEPRALREVHEIREKIYEETKNLSAEERAALTNKIGREVAEKFGLKIIQKV